MTATRFPTLEVGAPADDPMQAFDVLWDFLVPVAEPRASDLIFCFGSRDPGVPRRAAELYADGTAAHVVVAGGVSHEEGLTEAATFTDVLVAFGVPADRIVTEGESRHTAENVTRGLSVARDTGIEFSRVALVTWPVATRRSLATFVHLEPDLEAWSAPSTPRAALENRGSTKTTRSCVRELDKIRHHGDRGWIAAQHIPQTVTRAAEVLRQAHGL